MLNDTAITVINNLILLTLSPEQRANIKKYLNIWCKVQYEQFDSNQKGILSFVGINDADSYFNEHVEKFAQSLECKENLEEVLEKLEKAISIVQKLQPEKQAE